MSLLSRLGRLACFSATVAIAACSTTRSVVTPSSYGTDSRSGSQFVAEPGRDADVVAEMRAAPAPAVPELVEGGNVAADLNRLAAQGYVRIGAARYADGNLQSIRDNAIRQGQAAGADRIVLYAPTDNKQGNSSDTAIVRAPTWIANYFVHFKLAFGATFRDIDAGERTTLLVDGGVRIGRVIGGSPASRANLLPGDFVVAVNDHPVKNKVDFRIRLRADAGRNATLTIIRNGQRMDRVVRLGGAGKGSH